MRTGSSAGFSKEGFQQFFKQAVMVNLIFDHPATAPVFNPGYSFPFHINNIYQARQEPSPLAVTGGQQKSLK